MAAHAITKSEKAQEETIHWLQREAGKYSLQTNYAPSNESSAREESPYSTACKAQWPTQAIPPIRLSNLRLSGRATRITSSCVSGPVLN